jgi:hypothetical protein
MAKLDMATSVSNKEHRCKRWHVGCKPPYANGQTALFALLGDAIPERKGNWHFRIREVGGRIPIGRPGRIVSMSLQIGNPRIGMASVRTDEAAEPLHRRVRSR